MNKLSVTIKDDNGRDCSIENIRTFQKHLMVFHKTGVSIHDENGHYFTNIGREKIPTFLSGMLTGQRALDNYSLERLGWHIKQVIDKW